MVSLQTEVGSALATKDIEDLEGHSGQEIHHWDECMIRSITDLQVLCVHCIKKFLAASRVRTDGSPPRRV